MKIKMSIYKTTYPKEYFSKYGEWIDWLNKQEFSDEEKERVKFERLWANMRYDIIKTT
tara:strand:+ start:898 stop:1071 length:174 start_codon:yes stop_codon:yes gene_type:complete